MTSNIWVNLSCKRILLTYPSKHRLVPGVDLLALTTIMANQHLDDSIFICTYACSIMPNANTGRLDKCNAPMIISKHSMV